MTDTFVTHLEQDDDGKHVAPAPPPPTLASTSADGIARTLGYITEAQLCALAKVQQATARNWRARRKGPEYVVIGNQVLYPINPFLEWLKRRTTTTTAA